MLNLDQYNVAQAAIKWYKHSSDTLFQIDGEAGTGKSFLVNYIVQELNLKPEEVLPMAYTGQAAIVMRTKGLMNAVTCHSGLFECIEEIARDPNTGMPLMNETLNVPLTRRKFVPRDFSMYNGRIKLIIIDEGWMVPRSFKKYIDATGIKTIVTGDTGQLPPVGDDPAYFLFGKIHHLSQLMRQAELDPIVYIARQARRGYAIQPGLYGNNVLVLYEDEICNDHLRNSDITICCRNTTRENINHSVRKEIIGTDSTVPLYGERMICKKNNWDICVDGIALANGLVGTVSRPPDISKFDGECYTMNFLPDLLNKSFVDIRCDYKYLNAPYSEKIMIKESKYSQGEKFDYAYASTVHSAQGSEYNNGIYIEEYLRKDIQNNLNYTAITRFKQRLLYVKKRPKSMIGFF